MALKDKLMTLEDFKAVRDVDVASNSAQFTEIKADLSELSRLDDITIKPGTNLFPSVTESGSGGYQSTNGVISPVTASGYAYIKMPVTEKTAYFCNDAYRWMFTVDSNGAVVDEINVLSNTFVTGNGAVECCLTYHAINRPLTSISEIVALPANADTVYMLPHNVVPDDYKPGNLFGDCGLLGTGIYVGVSSNGELYTATNAAFNSYILPVDGISKYTFTACRFAVPLSYDRKTALVTSALANVDEIDTSSYNGCRYIAFSFNITRYPVDNYAVHKDGIINNTYPYWTGGQSLNNLLDGITDIYPVKTPFASGITNALADGEKVILANTMCELRKGDRVVLECDIALFSAIEIGLSDSVTSITNSHKHNYFVIDGTNISYYISSSSTAYNVPHGLSISDNVQIVLELEKNNNLKFTLFSDGQMFANIFAPTVKSKQGVWYVTSNGSTLTDVKVTWSCADFRKKIWIFGDSYLGYSTSRWLYYLGQFEYDENCLINAFSGEGGRQDMVSFNTLLNFGTPKYAVWCVGMNDESDANSEPSADWLAYVTAFIKRCRTESITPILATIPTVPGINHEYKNAWVRASGYRYIDFAKAVGATSSGIWFSGMLSSDNVHPTEQGAKALFARALLDLPELMLD